MVLAYARQGFLDDLQPTAQKDRSFEKQGPARHAVDGGLTVGNCLGG